MMTNRVLVLGGGFGGIAGAAARRERLEPGDEVVLVERRTTFVMGLRKNWAVLNAGAVATGERPLSRLGGHRIPGVHGTVGAAGPGAGAAVVDGERFEADAVVVALGAARAPEAVPGFAEHAI